MAAPAQVLEGLAPEKVLRALEGRRPLERIRYLHSIGDS
jgi:hypothetical protein